MDAEVLLNNSRPQIRQPLKSGEIPSNSSAGVGFLFFFFFFRSSDLRRNAFDNGARQRSTKFTFHAACFVPEAFAKSAPVVNFSCFGMSANGSVTSRRSLAVPVSCSPVAAGTPETGPLTSRGLQSRAAARRDIYIFFCRWSESYATNQHPLKKKKKAPVSETF